MIQRLVSFPNVIVTRHQAFFTREAVDTILETTLRSISDFAAGRPLARPDAQALDVVEHGAADRLTREPGW